MLTPPLILGSTALNSGQAITFSVVSHLSLEKQIGPLSWQNLKLLKFSHGNAATVCDDSVMH